MRGFTSPQTIEFHEALKLNAIKLLSSLIEGSVEIDVYKQISDSLDDF